MAKDTKKKKKQLKEISMTPLLCMGFIILLITLVLSRYWAGMPEWLSSALYIVAILSLVVYMAQIAFERRTGKAELTDKEIKALKKEQKQKTGRK